MSGVFSISVTEARGQIAIPAELDRLAIVVGATSAGSGMSSFYASGSAAVAALGYGDAVDAVTQIIEQKQATGTARKYPVACYSATTLDGSDGSFGTIHKVGTGVTVMSAHSGSKPFGTYELVIKCITGGTIGTAGVQIRYSLDGGRHYSPVIALGTATTFVVPNSGIQVDFTVATIVAGDTFSCRTFAPQPGPDDLTAAFDAIAASTIDSALVVVEGDTSAGNFAAISSGIDACLAVGKRVTVLCRTRLPDFEASETEQEWADAMAAGFHDLSDSRIHLRASYGLLTDAMTGNQYLRGDLAQYAADAVRVSRSSFPDVPSDQPMANFTLVDAAGVTVGHDEGPRGAVTGLSNETLGNRFGCVMRLPDATRREQVFSCVPWVMYASDERIKNLPTRRIANAMERVAVSAGTSQLGAKLFYTPADGSPGSQAQLTDISRNAIHGVIYQALSVAFAGDIQNANAAGLDTGLVQVSPYVSVSGGNLLTVSVTLSPLVFGYLLSLDIVLAIQE